MSNATGALDALDALDALPVGAALACIVPVCTALEFFRVCLIRSSALTSRSNCSVNCRAMARARPIQLPTCRATLGSFSGPSTMSAIAEVRTISENPKSSMRDQALVLGGTLSASRALAASKSASF